MQSWRTWCACLGCGLKRAGVTAKDLALHISAQHGVAGGRRSAIEYCGEAISALSIEERLTLCNMAVEFSAFTALIAPDQTVLDYVSGRPFAPRAQEQALALTRWAELVTDEGATFDHELSVDATGVLPMVSWGTSPEHAIPINGSVPNSAEANVLH